MFLGAFYVLDVPFKFVNLADVACGSFAYWPGMGMSYVAVSGIGPWLVAATQSAQVVCICVPHGCGCSCGSQWSGSIWPQCN